jgi:hypothetical protein
MLDLPGQPILDKAALVGGCARLPLAIDSERLRDEVARLPGELWGSPGGRIGVHRVSEALFLRGYAPAEGEKPIEDRPALNRLPYTRRIIEKIIPAAPQRCLLARLPAGATIAPHIDRAPYFAKTLRVHVAIDTNSSVHMVAAGRCYSMLPGEIWVLNNTAMHAVWNAHETSSRTHMICDFLPNPALLELLQMAERDLGVQRASVNNHFDALRSKGEAVTG